ncbi:MAG: hypothetical protein HN742_22660 [Lentisphaerae bacterium]|jgi:hypothetical protein|nr:hypothetical protein [Lentisphaerota bacterium]MBT5612492.1 hypothetical protein [Lentisphaerota bacterium]MBT7844697.1 hypothetical protein [Lentisphaerota bacterium]
MALFGETRQVSVLDVQELLYRCGMGPKRGLLDVPARLVHHHEHSYFRQVAGRKPGSPP